MRLLDENLLNEIGEYIKKYQVGKGESPSQRKIADKLKIDHRKTYRYVHALADRGIIDLESDGTITVPYKFDPSKQNIVPLIGAVRCGTPTLAIEEYDGIFKLPQEFTGTGTFYMLRAKGDSMVDAGIYENDYLIIREQKSANIGDIVVAYKICEKGGDDAAATLKRYKKKNDKYILHPENEDYEDIDANGYHIIGKLVSFIRRFNL